MEINVLRVEGIASILVSLPQKYFKIGQKISFLKQNKKRKLVDDMSNERNHEIVQKKPIDDFEQRLGKNPFCLIIK